MGKRMAECLKLEARVRELEEQVEIATLKGRIHALEARLKDMTSGRRPSPRIIPTPWEPHYPHDTMTWDPGMHDISVTYLRPGQLWG